MNPCSKDFSGNTPLYYATNFDFAEKFITTFYSRTNITLLSPNDLLIFAKEIAHTFPDCLISALCLASRLGYLPAVKSLILAGANPSSPDSNGNISVHIAVSEDFIDIVKYFIGELKLDCSCSLRDNTGSTPLHHIRSVDMARLLVERNLFDINAKDNSGNTPLLKAALHGELNVFRYLVFCAHCNILVTAENGWSPLHTACEHGFLDVVKHVINALGDSSGAVNDFSSVLQAERIKRQTPLHIACQNGHTEIMHCLLKDTEINPCCEDYMGNIPLHYLRNAENAITFIHASYSCSGIITSSTDSLCTLAKEICHRFPNQLNVCLNISCKKGHLEAVKSLILEGASLSYKDSDGNTLLHIASSYGNSGVVDYLIERRCSTRITDAMGNTALHMAAAKGHLQAVRSLYSSRDCVPDCRGENNRTPLHIACKSGQMDVVQYIQYMLDKEGLNPNSMDVDGNTPLHLAAQSGWLNIVQFIVKNDKHGTLNFKNHMNRTPMEEAYANSQFHIALHLISHTEPALSPIQAVLKAGHVEFLKYILSNDESSLNEQDEEGNTLLHFAVQSDNTEMVASVIYAKGDYSHCYSLNKCGHTPIQTAIKYGCLKVIKYMLRMYEESTKNISQSSLIHTACYAGHLNVLKCLIQEFHFCLDCVDDKGRTPLYSAVAAGKFEIIKYLVEPNQCDINKVSIYTSDTPLHVASSNGHMNIVLYLLSKGCKLNDDKFTWHALHAACQGGHIDIAKHLIIYADVDPFCLDNRGNIPLHYAANSGDLHLVEYLTKNGQGPKNPKNKQNNTPLHNAAVSGHYSIVKHLIETGICTPEDKGCFEQTALHYACQGGHFEIVKYLIEEQNQDVTQLDERGCSALDLATGHDSIVMYLSENMKSSGEPSAKKPKLDIENICVNDSELVSSEEGSAKNAEDTSSSEEEGSSSSEEDSSSSEKEDSASSEEDSATNDIRLGTPAKKLKLTSAKRRNRLYKNVSWMPSMYLDRALHNVFVY